MGCVYFPFQTCIILHTYFNQQINTSLHLFPVYGLKGQRLHITHFSENVLSLHVKCHIHYSFIFIPGELQ